VPVFGLVLPEPLRRRMSCGGQLMGGTSTIGCREPGGDASTASLVGGWERVAMWGVGERARCWVLRDRPRAVSEDAGRDGFSDFLLNRLWLGMGECRPYVENYTVDASIFERHLRVSIRNNVLTLPFGAADKPLVMFRRRRSCPCGGGFGVGTRFILMYVVKFRRANGGCLGNWSRRRT
jgi:hypothetical protein